MVKYVIHSHTVQVHPPHKWCDEDRSRLEQTLGFPPIWPIDDIDHFTLLVNGQVHTVSVLWLTRKADQSSSTSYNAATALKKWVEFLVNQRGRWKADERYSDVMVATEEDYRAFRKHLTEGPDGIGAERWNQYNTALVSFHKHALTEFNVPLPFGVERFITRDGQVVQKNNFSIRSRSGSSGTALEPDFVDVFLQAAQRVDSSGNEHDSDTSNRDLAFIRHQLATGMRRSSVLLTTHYEIPAAPPNNAPFLEHSVPNATTKNGKGGKGLAFSHHFEAVRAYNQQSHLRSALVAASIKNHKPAVPIVIHDANETSWRFLDPVTGELKKRFWTLTDADVRRRLVDVDGSSPMLHLVRGGTPMSSRTASRIVTDTTEFARQHVDPDFPEGFREHDLRHTFAVHLVMSIFHGLVQNFVDPAEKAFYQPLLIDSAVATVQHALGHSNPATTGIYTRQASAQMLAGIPAHRYLGKRN